MKKSIVEAEGRVQQKKKKIKCKEEEKVKQKEKKGSKMVGEETKKFYRRG